MIKIDKDLAKIPASLQMPPMNRSAKTTHRIRERIIRNGTYPKKSSTVDKRFKMADIKEALFEIYNRKCAFCEQKVEASHIEHFRPKGIYYWLAFAWSNLLYACFYCNNFKRKQFEVGGTRVVNPPVNLDDINIISHYYDSVEKPKFINPELEDPELLLNFQKDGFVKSCDSRCRYTIEACRIDRRYLNDERKKVWDKFINDLNSEVLDGKTKEGIKNDVMVLVRQFKRDSENKDLEFLAFRRYAFKHFLIEQLQEILGN